MNIIRTGTRNLFAAKNLTIFTGGANQIRTLFSKEELGIVQFNELRAQAQKCFESENHVAEHKKILQEKFSGLSLQDKRDQLKYLIYLIDGKQPDDLATVKEFVLQYNSDFNNTLHSVKEYHFGAIIMRMCYVCNLTDGAIKFYEDAELKGLFDQMATYRVFFDLLFESQRHETVISYYKDIRKRLDLFEKKPDVTLNVLVFAACYKLNTPEHFTYAKNLWYKVCGDYYQCNRTKFLLASLALKQNNPEYVLDLLPGNNNYVTNRFLKLMAFAQLRDFQSAFNLIRQTIEIVNTGRQKPQISEEVLNQLQKSLEDFGSPDEMKEYQDILQKLKNLELISKETLDSLLCAPFPPMLPKKIYRKLKARQSEYDD